MDWDGLIYRSSIKMAIPLIPDETDSANVPNQNADNDTLGFSLTQVPILVRLESHLYANETLFFSPTLANGDDDELSLGIEIHHRFINSLLTNFDQHI